MLKPNKLEEKILTKFGYGHGKKTKFTNPEACLVGAASIRAFAQHLNHYLENLINHFKATTEEYQDERLKEALSSLGELLLGDCENQVFVSIGMDRAIDLLEFQERRRELPDLKAALKYLEIQDFKDVDLGITKLKNAIARLEYEGENDGDQ